MPAALLRDAALRVEAFARVLGLAETPDPSAAQRRDQALQGVLERAQQAGLLAGEVGLEQLRGYYRLFESNLRAMEAYAPRPYDGGVVVFRSAGRSIEGDPTLGWGTLAAGGVEAHAIPGDHFTLLREPHVQVLAERLARCLHRRFHYA